MEINQDMIQIRPLVWFLLEASFRLVPWRILSVNGTMDLVPL